jgi:hypothetical protein
MSTNSNGHLELIYKTLTTILNDIERRNLQDRINDQDDDYITKIGKSVLSLKKKFYMLSDEVLKTKLLAQDLVEDRNNTQKEKMMPEIGADDDYTSIVLSLQNYFAALQCTLNNKNEMKERENELIHQEILMALEKKLETMERGMEEKNEIIFNLKKENNEKGQNIYALNRMVQEEKEKLQNIQDFCNQIQRENDDLKNQIKRKEEELHKLRSTGKKQCCNIF